jgi:hypothetical protein
VVGLHTLPWQSGTMRTEPWILVAGDCSDSVFGYDLAQPGAPQVYYIFEGLTYPTALAVDAQGYVYVANAPITCAAHSSDVMVYGPGQQFPSLELVGLASPTGIAVDAQRDVTLRTKVAYQKSPYTSPVKRRHFAISSAT